MDNFRPEPPQPPDQPPGGFDASTVNDLDTARLALRWALERLHRLQALLFEQQTAFNAAQAGKTLKVLFEKKGRYDGQAIGRSPYLQAVHVEAADHLLGQIVPVEIVSGAQNSLNGRLVDPRTI